MLYQNIVLSDSLDSLDLTPPEELAKREHYEAGCKIENYHLKKKILVLIEEIDIVIICFNHMNKILYPYHEGYSRKPIEKKDITSLPFIFDNCETLKNQTSELRGTKLSLDSTFDDLKFYFEQLCKEYKLYSGMTSTEIVKFLTTVAEEKIRESKKNCDVKPKAIGKRVSKPEEINQMVEQRELVMKYMNAKPLSRDFALSVDVDQIIPHQNSPDAMKTPIDLNCLDDLYNENYQLSISLNNLQVLERIVKPIFDAKPVFDPREKRRKVKEMKLKKWVDSRLDKNGPKLGFYNSAEVTRVNSEKTNTSSCNLKSTNKPKKLSYDLLMDLDYALEPFFERRGLLKEGGDRLWQVRDYKTENEKIEAPPLPEFLIKYASLAKEKSSIQEVTPFSDLILKYSSLIKEKRKCSIQKENAPFPDALLKFSSLLKEKEKSSINNFFKKVFKAESVFKKPTFKKPNFERLAFKKPDFKKPDFKKPDFKKPDFKKLAFKKPEFKNLTFKKPVFEKLNFHIKKNLFHKQNESIDPTNEEELNVVDERLECDSKVEASDERYDDSVVVYFLDLLSPTRQDYFSRYDYDELISNERHLERIIIERDLKNRLQINTNNQLRRIFGAPRLEKSQNPFISPIGDVKDIQSWSYEELKNARKALKNQHTRLQDENELLRFMLVSFRNLDLGHLDKNNFKPQGLNVENIIDSYKLEIDDLKIKIEESDSQIKELLSRKKLKTILRSLKIRKKVKKSKNDDEPPKMPEVDEDGKLDMEALHLYTQYLRTIYEKKSMELNTYLGRKKTFSKSVEIQHELLDLKQDFKDLLNAYPLSVAGGEKNIPMNVSDVLADIDNYKLEIDDLKTKIEELDSQIKEQLSRNKFKTLMRSLKIRNRIKEDKNDDEPPKIPEVDENGMLDMDGLRLYTQYLRTIYEKKLLKLNTYLGKEETSSKSVVRTALEDQAIKNNEVVNGSMIALHDGETQLKYQNSKSETKDAINLCSSSVVGCDKNGTKNVTGVSDDNQIPVKKSKRINVFKTPKNSFNNISNGNKNVEILNDEEPVLKGKNSTQLPIDQVPEPVQNQRRKINEGLKIAWRGLKKLFQHVNEENENIVDVVPIHHEENENIVDHVPMQQESTQTDERENVFKSPANNRKLFTIPDESEEELYYDHQGIPHRNPHWTTNPYKCVGKYSYNNPYREPMPEGHPYSKPINYERAETPESEFQF